MALLHACCELRSRHENLRVSALHIHFGLRGEDSDADASFVQSLCKDWSVPLLTYAADWNPKSVSQERTRKLRLQLSESVLPEAFFLEAHHQDDQIETFVFRLFRSSGLKGLEGIKSPSLRNKRLAWRPFLKLPKSALKAYLDERKISFRIDQSNLKSDYQRNWLRNELFPLLETQFPYFRESILRTRDQIQEENQHFDEELSHILERCVLGLQPLRLKVTVLRQISSAVLSRFLRWLFEGEFQIVLDREKVSDLKRLLLTKDDFVWNAPRGLQLRLSQGELSFGPQYQKRPLEASLPREF